MKQVWMCREDVGRTGADGSRGRSHAGTGTVGANAQDRNVKKSEEQTEPMAPTAPESPDIAAPAD
jgi:hypothetical protein